MRSAWFLLPKDDVEHYRRYKGFNENAIECPKIEGAWFVMQKFILGVDEGYIELEQP